MDSTARFKEMIPFLKFKFTIVMILCAGLSGSYAQVANVNANIHAHRGGLLEFEENTLGALMETHARGIRGFEIDIRQTKDGHLVLLHDESLVRMAGIEDGIENLTLDEIKQIKTKQGNSIPTLDEVLEFFKNKEGVYMEIEMKTNKPMYDESTLKNYCDQLYSKVYAAMPATSTYTLTSFDKRPLKYLKENYPETDLMFIKSEGLSEKLLQEVKELGLHKVACRIEGTSRKMVQQAKKDGFTVCLWPGNSIDDFMLGVALGADRLCTDMPLTISEWVKENASWINLK